MIPQLFPRTMPRLTTRYLITSPTGLGYCCPFHFFSLYKNTALIADRLGVSQRAVRALKAEVRRGGLRCGKHDKPPCKP